MKLPIAAELQGINPGGNKIIGDEIMERDLLYILKEATAHPAMLPIDFGLSGKVLVDHVIGRFEQVIDNYESYENCPEIIRKGYEVLRQLYPLNFRKSF